MQEDQETSVDFNLIANVDAETARAMAVTLSSPVCCFTWAYLWNCQVYHSIRTVRVDKALVCLSDFRDEKKPELDLSSKGYVTPDIMFIGALLEVCEAHLLVFV